MEELIEIKEGKVRLKIYNPSRYLRPDGVYEPSWSPVFYNPQMTFDRDLSVVALHSFVKYVGRPCDLVIDLLGGTGVRGLRYCAEIESVGRCVINDIDERAYKLIRENTEINSLRERVIIFNSDANALLNKLRDSLVRADFIDIDPYGSPAPYVRASLNLVKRGKLLALTATDTAPLMGVKERAGSRKYLTRLEKTDIPEDVGLRVLVGYAARVAAEQEKYVTPLLAYKGRHYFRVLLAINKGSEEAFRMLSRKVGYLRFCTKCGFREYTAELGGGTCTYCGSRLRVVGPLWVGELGDGVFMETVGRELREFSYLSNSGNIRELINTLKDEVSLPLTVNRVSISKLLKMNIPKKQEIIECLKEAGFKAVGTHLNSQYIKTNASWDEVVECFKKSGY